MAMHRIVLLFLVPGIVWGLAGASALAGDFESTSTGADGELIFAAAAGVVVFDPADLTNDDGDPIDPEGDNIFHFTSIEIPTGTTVTLSAEQLGGDGRPVIWLASEDVTIDGILALDGQAGHGASETEAPSVPGAGGFTGGASVGFQQSGNGPGGGTGVDGEAGGPGAYRTRGGTSSSSGRGASYGNRFLMPLLGGSGGGAGTAAGGGGGGGGLLIASSTEIIVDGTIRALGGASGTAAGTTPRGGGGSGGAIRLMAPTVSGSGTVNVSGGTGLTLLAGGSGWIRIQAIKHGLRKDGTFTPLSSVSFAAPGIIFPPDDTPTLRITGIDGADAPELPTGSFESVDVVIDSSEEVTIDLEATNIPTGTTITLILIAEDGASESIESTELDGTLSSSTATATATFVAGFTRITIRAEW